ncbi:hypothetical protein [uncultured Sphingomonas sp.]|uniref:hypothetical protein n=1 Tax=uncultured Sphingomonas sp. TaxID=158754 RepID=UPI0035CA229C
MNWPMIGAGLVLLSLWSALSFVDVWNSDAIAAPPISQASSQRRRIIHWITLVALGVAAPLLMVCGIVLVASGL